MAELRARAGTISGQTLEAALAAHQAEVRALAVAELARRGELRGDQARQFLEDPAGVVREAIAVAGFPDFAEGDLDLALTDFPSEARVFEPDRTERMRLAYFRRLDTQTLREKIDWFDPTDAQAAYEVLATDHFGLFSHELRSDLRDRFEGLKKRSLDATAERMTPRGAQLIAERFQELDDFIRDGFVIAALRGLIANGTRRDSEIVRP
jgi:hypothetical protein